MNSIVQLGNIVNDGISFKNRQTGRVYSVYGIAPTLNTCRGGGREPKVLTEVNSMNNIQDDKSLKKSSEGSVIVLSEESANEVLKDDCQTNTKDDKYRIRKLTPKECFRLMGFSDEDFEKVRNALNQKHHKGKDRSSSQLYKQAGNSIVVNVLYYIYKQLYEAMPYLFDDLKVGSYFSGIGAFEKGLDMLYKDINGCEDK